jgi:amino acid transporter
MFATIVLVVFSVGYVAMARKKTTAGGFYSYISHGLGRELGIGTGYASVVAYSVFEASLAGGFAYFLSLKLNQFGVNIAWPWLALAMVLIISILTYFDVRISSMVLAVGLISEVVILLIFDVFLFARGHVTAAPLNPVNAFKSFPAEGKIAGGRDRHRPVLRLLVLGRLRDGAELRRGVPRLQADRPPRACTSR